MCWFKHFTDYRRDPVVYAGFARFGHLSYVFLLVLRGVYAELFDSRDSPDFIRVSPGLIPGECRTVPRKFLDIPAYYQDMERLENHLENDFHFFELVGYHLFVRIGNREGKPRGLQPG